MTATSSTKTNAKAIISALGLPDSCRVDQRVPKKLLLGNGAPTALDKRLITEAIEEIQWIAALKPNTIGVPDYRDTQREYLEIAFLDVTLRDVKPAQAIRLTELVHRAVPYPVLLLLIQGPILTLSLAHKRWAQNEPGRVVLDGRVVVASLSDTTPSAEAWHAFLRSFSLARQPRATLLGLYQGWMDCVGALLAASLTGTYRTTETRGQAAARWQALAECERLDSEISRLRAQVSKEKQLARQVAANLQLKALLAERQRVTQNL